MYSAKDKMTVYQSSSTQTGTGRVIASTQNNRGLVQLTSSEKNELGQAFGIAPAVIMVDYNHSKDPTVQVS